MTYWVLRFASWFLKYVHEAIGYPACALIGDLYYTAVPSRRDTLECNLRMALAPDQSARRLKACGRQAFRSLVANYYELFHMRGFGREQFRRRVHLEGFEHIEAGLARGRGVMLASLHLGNVETLMQVTTFYPQLRFLMLVEKMQNPGLLRAVSELRRSMGVELATTEEPLRVVRRLRENGVVGIACDRDVTGTGVLVNFFGKAARLPDAPVRIAARSGATLIPAYGWRNEDGDYSVRVEPPLALQQTGSATDDAAENMRRLVAALERIIRQQPCQWMAFHRIWT